MFPVTPINTKRVLLVRMPTAVIKKLIITAKITAFSAAVSASCFFFAPINLATREVVPIPTPDPMAMIMNAIGNTIVMEAMASAPSLPTKIVSTMLKRV